MIVTPGEGLILPALTNNIESSRMNTLRTLLSIVAVAALVRTSVTHGQTGNPASGFQVVEATVEGVHAAMTARKLTAHELVQAYLDRINAYDKSGPALNCIISLNPRALEEADRLDAAFKRSGMVGPLHGIPVLVKDEIDAAGMPTTLGTLVFKDYRPVRDAFVVDRLKKAGAVILGKTTLSEYAIGDTYGSMFGASRNPYDLERTVGGSSGGSGCATAANFSTLALGEETVASIRRPGGWNAVASLRRSIPDSSNGTDGANDQRSRPIAGCNGGLRS
jgi:amidase